MVEELGLEAVEAETPGPGAVDWYDVRDDYEGGVGTLREIAEKFGVTEAQIRHRRQKEGWMLRRKGKPDALKMLDRMLFVLDCQIRGMEERMRKSREDAGGERDAALLANMAKTLEKLLEMKAGQAGHKVDAKKPPIDIEDLRERLAKRIDELNRG